MRRLRKPSQAAWALNQVARREPDAVERLLEAGSSLREAQDAVVSGEGDPAGLREAVEAEREAAVPLLDEAGRVLGERGRPATAQLLDRVRETLHAAAGDEGVADRLRAGRLVEDHRSVGLGGWAPGTGAETAPRTRRPAQRGGQAKPRGARTQKSRAGRARERAPSAAADRQRLKRIAEAKKRLRAAQADADRARRELAAAEHDRERAELAFRSAERASEEARGRAEGVQAEVERLRGELEGLES